MSNEICQTYKLVAIKQSSCACLTIPSFHSVNYANQGIPTSLSNSTTPKSMWLKLDLVIEIRERAREQTFQNFYKDWTSSFQRPNPSTSSSLHYKGGWVKISTRLFLFLLHFSIWQHNDSLHNRVACSYALLHVLYNIDKLFHRLSFFARICTLLRVFAIKWYPTTWVWFWLSHTLEVQSTIFLLHLKVHIANPPRVWSTYKGIVPSNFNQ
jgi:hypothetical protein